MAGKFLDDQVNADEPFMPPENAREHCLYLMNPTQADAYLEKLGLKKVGKTGDLNLMGEICWGLRVEDVEEIVWSSRMNQKGEIIATFHHFIAGCITTPHSHQWSL